LLQTEGEIPSSYIVFFFLTFTERILQT